MAFWLSFMRNNQISKILNGSWVIPKNLWKNTKKTGFRRNRLIPKTNKEFWFKIGYDTFKTSMYIVFKFQIFIFWTDWVITHLRALRLGRAGRFHHGYRLYVQKEAFLFYRLDRKNQKFLRYRFVWKSHMTVERSSLASSLAIPTYQYFGWLVSHPGNDWA